MVSVDPNYQKMSIRSEFKEFLKANGRANKDTFLSPKIGLD